MIKLKINTKNGTLTEVNAALVAVIGELDQLKEKGVIEGYSDVEVVVDSSGGYTHEKWLNDIQSPPPAKLVSETIKMLDDLHGAK